MPTYSDFAYYDTTAPARDVLISLAERYDVPVSYLNNSVITRSEIRSIYSAEQAAIQLALENYELTFDEWADLVGIIGSKFTALLKKLQDVKRASFRDIFTKAAVEEIACSLSYETSYGSHNVYQIWPFEVKLRGKKGDLYYARDVADSITKSFLLLGFIDLTFQFSGGNLVHFSSPYPLPTTMQNRYDSYSLSDLVVSERDLVVFTPPPSTPTGTFPYVLETGAATYTFDNPYEFISTISWNFDQLVNTVTNFGLVGLGGIENPISYLNAVQNAYNTYEFFATAYNAHMADSPAWGHFDLGYDVWDAIRIYAPFLNSIASINDHQFYCAMLDHFLDPFLNIWNGYPIDISGGSPPHYWQFIDSIGFNAAYNRQWVFANDPQHVILGMEALFRSVGYFDII